MWVTTVILALGVIMIPNVESKSASSDLQIIKPDLGCKYNGRYYKDGAIIKGFCFVMKCIRGRWYYVGAINKKCARCQVWQDPFFKPFDASFSQYYVWDGKCNYTISQPLTFGNKHLGLHSHFKKCSSWSSRTCLDRTTFKAALHTAITIFHGSVLNILVNGNPLTITATTPQLIAGHSVFAWRSGSGALNLQGPRLAIRVTYRTLDVFAPQSLSGNLVGLCGYFDNNQVNDHRRRDGTVDSYLRYPYWFPRSWLSYEQENCTCFNPKYYLPSRFLSLIERVPDESRIELPARRPSVNDRRIIAESRRIIGSVADNLTPDNTQRLVDASVEVISEDPDNEGFWRGVLRQVAVAESELADIAIVDPDDGDNDLNEETTVTDTVSTVSVPPRKG